MSNSNNHHTKKHFPKRPPKINTDKQLIVLFNKPYNTLSQFTGEASDSTLADFIDIKNIYAAGRLDKDSEGLMVLTNDGQLQNRISSPKHKMKKRYWAQLEGVISDQAISQLIEGVQLKDGVTKPAEARKVDIDTELPQLWERTPAVRFRKNIPTSWVELSISEGKNRQVRRMTAAVGFPTLRLVRMSIGAWQLDGLLPGEYKLIEASN